MLDLLQRQCCSFNLMYGDAGGILQHTIHSAGHFKDDALSFELVGYGDLCLIDGFIRQGALERFSNGGVPFGAFCRSGRRVIAGR